MMKQAFCNSMKISAITLYTNDILSKLITCIIDMKLQYITRDYIVMNYIVKIQRNLNYVE